MDERGLLAGEWRTLQHDHEQYERSALAIKLFALGLCLAGLATATGRHWMVLLLCLCWLQEGVLKTWQGRLGERLLRVEAALRDGGTAAMQLHSEWQAARPRGLTLLAGYAASAARPTVALPYLPLLLAIGVAMLRA